MLEIGDFPLHPHNAEPFEGLLDFGGGCNIRINLALSD